MSETYRCIDDNCMIDQMRPARGIMVVCPGCGGDLEVAP